MFVGLTQRVVSTKPGYKCKYTYLGILYLYKLCPIYNIGQMSFGGYKRKVATNLMRWIENMKKNESPSKTPGLIDVLGFFQFMYK